MIQRWWEGTQDIHLLCIGLFSFQRWKLIFRGEVTFPRSHNMSLDKLGLHCGSSSSGCGSFSLCTASMDLPTMCSSGHHSKTVLLNCFLPNKISVYASLFLLLSVCLSLTGNLLPTYNLPNHIRDPWQREKWWIQDFMGYSALFPLMKVWVSNQLGRKLVFVGLMFGKNCAALEYPWQRCWHFWWQRPQRSESVAATVGVKEREDLGASFNKMAKQLPGPEEVMVSAPFFIPTIHLFSFLDLRKWLNEYRVN